MELPGEIASQAEKVVEAKEKLEYAKLAYSASYADRFLGATAPNATEKKIKAERLTLNEKTDIVKAETKWETEKIHLEKKQNEFNALRKVANIEIRMMETQISGH